MTNFHEKSFVERQKALWKQTKGMIDIKESGVSNGLAFHVYVAIRTRTGYGISSLLATESTLSQNEQNQGFKMPLRMLNVLNLALLPAELLKILIVDGLRSIGKDDQDIIRKIGKGSAKAINAAFEAVLLLPQIASLAIDSAIDAVIGTPVYALYNASEKVKKEKEEKKDSNNSVEMSEVKKDPSVDNGVSTTEVNEKGEKKARNEEGKESFVKKIENSDNSQTVSMSK